MKKSLSFMLLVLGWLACPAASYYVSLSGNNNNPGTVAQPWLTIQHGLDVAGAGDIIYVRDGVYHEQLVFSRSGNAVSGPVTLKNYLAENPVLEGGSFSNNCMMMDNLEYITIDGFEIRNWTDFGEVITIQNYCHHITLSNLKVHDFDAYGLTFRDGCHDIVCNNVEVYRFGATGLGYGFDVSYNPGNGTNHDFTFNYCKVHSDLNPPDNVDGFAIGHHTPDEWQYNFTYNHCIVYDVYDGWDLNAKNTLVNSCLGYNCHNGIWKIWDDQVHLVNCIGYSSPGFDMGAVLESDYQGPGFEQYGKLITLQNCTFFGSSVNILWDEDSHLDTIVAMNCIFAGAKQYGIWFDNYHSVGNTFHYRGDYNIFHNYWPWATMIVNGTDYTFADWQNFSNQDQHSVFVGDPSTVFVDTLTSNFYLKAPGSPAINTGSSAGAPSVDFDGHSRPYGIAYDIGAYEWFPGAGVEDITPLADGFIIFPNPTAGPAEMILTLNESADIQECITDSKGQTVKKFDVVSGKCGPNYQKLDLSALAPGIYGLQVRITTEGRSYNLSKKVLKLK